MIPLGSINSKPYLLTGGHTLPQKKHSGAEGAENFEDKKKHFEILGIFAPKARNFEDFCAEGVKF